MTQPTETGGLRLQAFTGPQLVWVAAITMLAAALRLLCVGEWSFWVDEGHTWRDVTLPFSGPDSFASGYRRYYPLSFLLLRGVLETGLLPAHSEGWLRLPFVFLGILTVTLVAFVGKWFVGRRAALLAAFLLAINPWHIFFSQNARGYGMACMFALLAAGFWWRGLWTGRWRQLLLGLLMAVASGMSHPTGYLVLAPMLSYPLFRRLEGLSRQQVLKRLAIGILFAIVAAQLLLLIPPFEGFLRAKPNTSVAHMLLTTAWYFRPALLLLCLIGAWILIRSRRQGGYTYMLLWFLLPLCVLAVASGTTVKVTARYGFLALPAMLLLASATCMRYGEAVRGLLAEYRPATRWLAAALLPSLLAADFGSNTYLYFTHQQGDRGTWREACAFSHRDGRGKDGLTVLTVNEPSVLYYMRPDHYRDRRSNPYPDRQVYGIEQFEVAAWGGPQRFLDQHRELAGRRGHDLMLLISLPELEEKDPDGSLRRAIEHSCELRRVFPLYIGPKDETIYVYRLR